MKKIKFITPILVGASVLASSTAVLTGCEWGQNQNILTMTGGQHVLNGLVGMSDTCLQPWVVQFNGKTIKPDALEPVYFEIQPITELPKGLEIDVIPSFVKEGEETTYKIWWNAGGLSESEAGSYKFNVIAKYRWEGIRYYASTGCITLNIIKKENPTLTYPQGEDAIARLENSTRRLKLITKQNYVVATLRGFEYVGGYADIDDLQVEVDTDDTNDFGEYGFFMEYGDSKSSMWTTYNLIFWSDKLEWETKDHTITVSIKDTATGRYILRKVDFTLRASFEVDSWENVITQANKGLDHLKDYYHLDSFIPSHKEDSKESANQLNLERLVDVDGVSHRVRVIGENHDFTNADHTQTAALTFEFTNVVTKTLGDFENPAQAINVYWNETSAEPKFNIWWDGQQSCDLREYLNSTKNIGFLRSLPDALTEGIKPVYKATAKGNKDATLIDSKQKVWLLSATEMGASDDEISTMAALNEGTCYEYYKNSLQIPELRMKSLVGEYEDYPYWLRSPGCGTITIGADNLALYSYAGFMLYYLVDSTDFGFAPCFCI